MSYLSTGSGFQPSTVGPVDFQRPNKKMWPVPSSSSSLFSTKRVWIQQDKIICDSSKRRRICMNLNLRKQNNNRIHKRQMGKTCGRCCKCCHCFHPSTNITNWVSYEGCKRQQGSTYHFNFWSESQLFFQSMGIFLQKKKQTNSGKELGNIWIVGTTSFRQFAF